MLWALWREANKKHPWRDYSHFLEMTVKVAELYFDPRWSRRRGKEWNPGPLWLSEPQKVSSEVKRGDSLAGRKGRFGKPLSRLSPP